MRSPFKMPFTSLIKQQRTLEKAFAKAVKLSRKAMATANVPVAPLRKARPKTAPAAQRLEEVTAFGSNPGRLRMFAYAPPGLPRRSPLVVVLHGCQQDALSYDRGSGWSVLARERGFAVVYAEQTRSNNPNVCFNWFRPSNVTRDRGEVMSIRQMIACMAKTYGVDRKRIFITGLSAGGAMTAAMAAAYPDLFRGVGIIAGLPFGAARDVQRALEAMRQAPQRTPREWGDLVRAAADGKGPFPSVSIWHGTRDATVAMSNGEALVDQWLDIHGLDVASGEDSVVDGHLRRIWRNKKGEAAVSFYRIDGMGHGTPLKPHPNGRTRIEVAGPYMLDAGISSSLQLAEEWGLRKPVPLV